MEERLLLDQPGRPRLLPRQPDNRVDGQQRVGGSERVFVRERGQFARPLFAERLAGGPALPGGTACRGAELPRTSEITLDWMAVGFTCVATFLTGLAAAAVPARRHSNVDLARTMAGAPTRGRRTLRYGEYFVAFQVVVGTALLVSGGLAVRSLYRLAHVELGFEPSRVLVFELQLGRRYPPTAARAFAEELLRTGSDAPGVAAVALGDAAPLEDFGIVQIHLPDGRPVWVTTRFVTRQYFSVLGIPATQGGRDPGRFVGPGAAAVNDVFARRLLRGNPLGQRIWYGEEELEVTGVVGTARERDAREEPAPVLYRALADEDYRRLSLSLLVRPRGEPGGAASAVRTLIRRLDPDLPYRMTTLDAKFSETRSDTRLVAVAFGVTSIIALMLAAVGVFAQVRHAVALRTYEMAIRSAVGATPVTVARELLAPLLGKGAVALAVGLGLGSLVGRTMGAVLYGVLPTDAVTLATAALVIVVTVALACAGPARRAALAGPLGALRRELPPRGFSRPLKKAGLN